MPEQENVEHRGVEYIECGNTTYKLASRRGDGGWVVDRFRTTSKLISRLDRSRTSVIVSVAEERGVALAGECNDAGVDVRLFDRTLVAPFVRRSYDTPETIGLDRALNLLGVRGDGVVISCGTCITVDMVLGGIPSFGAILPGYTTASKGLASAVPVLPSPRLDAKPGLPATTSEESVTNGVLLSTTFGALAVASLLLQARAGNPFAAPLVLTGGAASLFFTLLMQYPGALQLWSEDSIRIVPGLLFEGVARVDR